MAYIYCIKNDVNEKLYVGKTIYSIENRFKRHLQDAHNHKYNSKLHRAILKYGDEHFWISLIEECNDEDAGKRERYYIQLYDTVKSGYNISYGGEGESQVDFKQLEQLFLQGYNFKEIAEQTGHTQKTVATRLKAAGHESAIGGYGKHSGNYNKGKSIEFNGQQFDSLTLLAKYLKTNIETFKDKEIVTIIKGISKSSKQNKPYCGYYFHRL